MKKKKMMSEHIHTPHREWINPYNINLTARQYYYWVNRVLVLDGNKVLKDLRVNEFLEKYPDYEEDLDNLKTSVNNIIYNFDLYVHDIGGYTVKSFKNLLKVLDISEDDKYIEDSLDHITVKLINNEIVYYPWDVENAILNFYNKKK